MAYRPGARLAALGGASLLCIASLGCAPPPESVGFGLSTDEGDGSSSGAPPEGTSTDTGADESTGEPHVGPEPKWEVLLEHRTACHAAEPMPDGGVAIIAESYDTHEIVLHRYAPDGTISWQQSGGSKSFSMDVLPDGRIVVGGSSSEDPNRAAVWLLSPEGDVLATYVPPPPELPEDQTWVSMIDADPSGVAFVVQHYRAVTDYEQPDYELAFADLDLEPHWWLADFKQVDLEEGVFTLNQVMDVQLGAMGSIRTLEYGSPDRIRSFSPTGELESEMPLDYRLDARLAEGAPGVLLEDTDEVYRLRGLEERPDLDVELRYDEIGVDPPGIGWLKVYHDGGNVLVADTKDIRHALWVSQLDADGTPIDERTLDPGMDDDMTFVASAPGPDDSVYFCGYYSEQDRGFLARRYPAW